MSELVLRFEHMVGRAALKHWPILPRDLQEKLFEDAVVATRPFAISSHCICTIIIPGRRTHQSPWLSLRACARKHLFRLNGFF